LRSRTSLIQTFGRAARNLNGQVIMYADRITRSMKEAMDETDRRRIIQQEYNKKNGITPESIIREIHSSVASIYNADYVDLSRAADNISNYGTPDDIRKKIKKLKKEMLQEAEQLNFEKAAGIRDQIVTLEKFLVL